ncbi:MAG: HNH endonuclease [Patescibacteria group bacterium]
MPDSSLDTELRAAAFARVQQLRDRYATRIPRHELMAGVIVRGQRIPIWNHMKGIFKPGVLGRGGAALSVQTSADSPYTDIHDIEAGRFIYKYRGQDPNQSDNVALRVAMEQAKPLIYLVAVDPGVYDAILPVYVVSDQPNELQFSLAADQPSALVTATDTATIGRREYATRAVMERLHRQHFRRIVLRAYREQCAICRIRHVELLDAAHILADKHPLGEPIVSNGLGLCKIHHSAYDCDILGVDPDSRVHIRGDVLQEKDGPMLLHGLQELHGTKLTLPRESKLKPNAAFLAERFERFLAA